jgi:O-antigen/teichoic acid export membrane protein
MGLLLYIFAPLLATNILNAPNLINVLRLSCWLIIFNTLNEVVTGSLAGLEAFKTISRVNLIRGLLNFPVMIVGVYFFALPGVVAAAGLTSAAGWLINRQALRHECVKNKIVINYHGFQHELLVLWRFSFPAFLTSVMVGPTLWVANTIIVNQPGGYGEMGLVNAVNQWKAVLLFLPVAIANVSLPAFSSVFSMYGTSSQTDQSVEIANAFNQVVLWPATICLMYLSSAIMSLFGPGFVQGRLIFVLMIGGTAIGYIGYPIGTLILSRGLTWFAVLQNLIWGILLISITIFTAPHYGALGFAIAMVISYFVLLNFSTIYMHWRNELPKTLARRVIIGGLVMLLLMEIAVYLPPSLSLWLALPFALAAVPLSLALLASPQLKISIRKLILSPLEKVQ